ncbi:MAG: hypothetical protein MRY21_02915 [Simkaniaceae bacterium]|nr:hypothetical protein [Simkaniaceae bacterium]
MTRSGSVGAPRVLNPSGATERLRGTGRRRRRRRSAEGRLRRVEGAAGGPSSPLFMPNREQLRQPLIRAHGPSAYIHRQENHDDAAGTIKVVYKYLSCVEQKKSSCARVVAFVAILMTIGLVWCARNFRSYVLDHKVVEVEVEREALFDRKTQAYQSL